MLFFHAFYFQKRYAFLPIKYICKNMRKILGWMTPTIALDLFDLYHEWSIIVLNFFALWSCCCQFLKVEMVLTFSIQSKIIHMTTKQFFLFTGIMDMFNSYYVHIVLIFSNKPSSLNDCHCGIVHQKMKQQLLKNGIKKCPLIFQGHHQQQNYENFIYFQLKFTTNTKCFVTGTLSLAQKCMRLCLVEFFVWKYTLVLQQKFL